MIAVQDMKVENGTMTATFVPTPKIYPIAGLVYEFTDGRGCTFLGRLVQIGLDMPLFEKVELRAEGCAE